MFEVKTARGYDAGRLKLNERSTDNFEFIGRTRTNYGVQGYIERQDREPNVADVFSVSQIGSVHAQIRKNKWYASQNIFILHPKFKNLLNLFL